MTMTRGGPCAQGANRPRSTALFQLRLLLVPFCQQLDSRGATGAPGVHDREPVPCQPAQPSGTLSCLLSWGHRCGFYYNRQSVSGLCQPPRGRKWESASRLPAVVSHLTFGSGPPHTSPRFFTALHVPLATAHHTVPWVAPSSVQRLAALDTRLFSTLPPPEAATMPGCLCPACVS